MELSHLWIKKKLISIGVKAVFTPKDFKIEKIMDCLVNIIRIPMSKKTLELTIHLLQQLFEYNLDNYLPIKLREKTIGWINKKKNNFSNHNFALISLMVKS